LKRKLLILDVALIAAAIFAGARAHSQWQAAKERRGAILSQRAAPIAAPQLAPLPAVPPVLPVEYADIAQKMLLDKSRNSTVVIETPAPPPPVPVPPLPFYHGQMRLPGEAPIVILSATAGAEHQAVHPGETIGPFKLVAVTSQELAFEWQGKTIRKNLDELIDRGGAGAAAPSASAASARPVTVSPPAPKSNIGPGVNLAPDVKACAANDSYEDGAVVAGYRKVMKQSPFGVSCRWDQVQ
jgi:hypothetical protein